VRGDVPLQDAVDRRERVVTRLVHHPGGEATDGGQLVLGEHPGHLVGVSGQKPSGPSSVAASPMSRISSSTRLGESW
jgi:hypothetical protein